MAGRKRKPTKVKELEGTLRADRTNELEPSPVFERPLVPVLVAGDSTGEAEKAWNGVCDMLEEMGYLSTAEVFLIESYAMNYSDMLRARKQWLEEGMTVMGSRGNVVRNPIALCYHKLCDRQLKMLVELGLTPSARSKIHGNVKNEESDPFNDWLKDSRN